MDSWQSPELVHYLIQISLLNSTQNLSSKKELYRSQEQQSNTNCAIHTAHNYIMNYY